MYFKAYRRPDGAMLLVPDCLIASREAQQRHGPLILMGRVDADAERDCALWNRVLADIDRQSYAVVRRSHALELLQDTPVAARAG